MDDFATYPASARWHSDPPQQQLRGHFLWNRERSAAHLDDVQDDVIAELAGVAGLNVGGAAVDHATVAASAPSVRIIARIPAMSRWLKACTAMPARMRSAAIGA